MPKRKIVKKWRFDQWVHPGTQTAIGIYLDPEDGQFYAFVPEVESGTLFVADTRDKLKEVLRREGAKLLELVWRSVIRVELAKTSSAWPHNGVWDPADPRTAGDTVSMDYDRLEVAEGFDNKRLRREWPRHHEPGWTERFGTDDHRQVFNDHWKAQAGVSIELPYSDELWDALASFRERIRLLNHSIRTFIMQENVGALLLSASGPLRLVQDPPPGEPS